MNKIHDSEFFDELIDNIYDMSKATDEISKKVKRAVTMYPDDMLPHYLALAGKVDDLQESISKIEDELTARHNQKCTSCGKASSNLTEVTARPGSTYHLCAGCLKGESER